MMTAVFSARESLGRGWGQNPDEFGDFRRQGRIIWRRILRQPLGRLPSMPDPGSEIGTDELRSP